MTSLTKIKISLSKGVIDVNSAMKDLEAYVDGTLTKHEGLPTHFYKEDERTISIETDYECASMCIDRLLEDYALLGTDCNVDIYSLIVFCSNTELNNYYNQERMNIQAESQESMFQAITEDDEYDGRIKNLSKRIGYLDATLDFASVYKFREVLTTLATELERNGISVLDAVNKSLEPKIQ